MTEKPRCVYDHRIKEAIVRSRNPGLFPELRIPPSTARSWIERGLGKVVSLETACEDEAVLRERIATLERRVVKLTAILRLTLTLLRVSGFGLDRQRMRDETTKLSVLCAVERTQRVMPLAATLKMLRVSASHYHV